jgi:threonine dehydrogenase-like Zn-dependent dehydrogenase
VKALTVRPGVRATGRVLDDAEEPRAADAMIVETRLVGVCGTDVDIMEGAYGTPPPGRSRLVLGHEAVGRVVQAPAGSGHAEGDLVVPIVRHPDPVPCSSCSVGEWDMCLNGRYTEHGIKERDGFAVQRFAAHPDRAVAVPPGLGDLAVLVEPASVVAKAWEQIERIGARSHWQPRTVLVTGAGPIGLLAALMARQRGLETHVLDIQTEGPKPALVTALGAAFHTGPVAETCPVADIVVECTGVGSVVLEAVAHNSPNGIICLTGLSSGTRTVDLDAAELNRRIVLENDVVFGTVNANRRHYLAAVASLVDADRSWLGRLITRRVPLDRWSDAFSRRPDDVKVVLDLTV